jgi:transcription-repair coupling factor (superfamily II helicase)
MNIFNNLLQKINNWNVSSTSDLNIDGIAPSQWFFIFQHFLSRDIFKSIRRHHLVVFERIGEAEDFHQSLMLCSLQHKILYLPGLESSAYSGFIPSEKNLFQRFNVLSQLLDDKSPYIIIATFEAVMLKNPPQSFFKENTFKIAESDIISPLELSSKLVDIGFGPSTTVEEAGSFSSKGEIFDIYPISGGPIRIHYFDDMIETINKIDPESNKTIKDTTFKSVSLSPSPHILSKKIFTNTLRKFIPMASPSDKERFDNRKNIFNKLSDGFLFEDYPSYAPLFFEKTETFFDYISQDDLLTTVIENGQCEHAITDFIETLRDQYIVDHEDKTSSNLLPSPEFLYDIDFNNSLKHLKRINLNELNIDINLSDDLENFIEVKLERTQDFINQQVNRTLEKREHIKGIFNFLGKHFETSGEIIFTYQNESSKKQFNFLMEEYELRGLLQNTHFVPLKLAQGFYYPSENILVLSDSDLFSLKKTKTKNQTKKNIDLFAEQLSTIKKNDYVIHSEHGLGKYLGLESLDIGGIASDYLVIEYTQRDKIYLPVYKMNLIQKHSDSSTKVQIASLRTNKFNLAKASAKNSAKKLAFDLLKLLAQRESSEAYAFSPPDDIYREFELSFPFEETPDQTSAISNVLEDMQKLRPMDHLVCGDVGYGKTEIAMRASFKAVLDHKQVAILVPTTILALQHYNSFIKRFKNFPVNINFLSRFKTTKESKEIKEKLKTGEIDIIIGTHKLLSKTILFKDLGLAIIDEEQRFGVGHKERLKLLKTTVDFLTLTATPIPRTLQMTFLGLRDLSLIQTAPPKRQSIKTYLIKEDRLAVQMAIKKELARGGQIFYVHNRVQSMEEVYNYLKELAPEAKIVMGHGQMNEKELEKRMKAFYDGEYDILLSTTIIESGIDIPNANTMIIDRANTYGLSQLHQLRGRIGRSDRKAYAYFIIPKNRKLTPIAEQRLKALQTYAEMGSGFNIASSDLEIRGAGDILGANQSGHIDMIGLELYMELLKEAIAELKGEKLVENKNIEIKVPFATYIPSHFIEDPAERLKYYKKISNCTDPEALELMKEEVTDIFGPFPQVFDNLFKILEIRNCLLHCGMKSLSLSGSLITIRFDKQMLEKDTDIRNRIVDTFLAKPKKYTFSPDFKVTYQHPEALDLDGLAKFSSIIAEEISSSM